MAKITIEVPEGNECTHCPFLEHDNIVARVFDPSKVYGCKIFYQRCELRDGIPTKCDKCRQNKIDKPQVPYTRPEALSSNTIDNMIHISSNSHRKDLE